MTLKKEELLIRAEIKRLLKASSTFFDEYKFKFFNVNFLTFDASFSFAFYFFSDFLPHHLAKGVGCEFSPQALAFSI